MKPLVIYHANCADGFGAAFAAWLKLGDGAEYLPVNYGADEEQRPPVDGREVYILDFSYDRQRMGIIFRDAARVVWLDHHKTAFEACGRAPNGPNEGPLYEATLLTGELEPYGQRHDITLDNNKSGAVLAWEHFHPGTEVPMLIQHIDDRDRWQFKLEGSKEIHAALASYQPWSFEQWSLVLWPNAFELREEGAAILRAHNQNVQAVLKQARECSIRFDDDRLGDLAPWNRGGYWASTGLAANAPAHLASDLGHELANKSGTFGLVWSVAGDLSVHCSLRSNDDYDVSAIAKVFGGGGHRNAAGFSTNIDTLMGWLK